MGMRIDKAGKNDASAEIQFLSLARFSQPLDFMLFSNGEDAIFANEQRTIAYDAEFAQCAPAARHGPAFALDLLPRARLWFLLPGLLGTFFVFASLYGYRHQGASATIVLVVAAQLVTGLALDGMGFTGAARPIAPPTLIGAALLLLGTALVVR